MQPDSSVMAAAARDELGALLDSRQIGTWGLVVRGKLISHRFEHGLVVTLKRGPLGLPYRDLRVYRQFNPTFSRGSSTVVFDWTLERSDGQSWETVGGWQDTFRSGRKYSPIFQVCEDALAQTCARQREAALQRLGEGATVAFGPVEIARLQMTFGRETVPWTSVTGFSLKSGRESRPVLRVQASLPDRFRSSFRVAGVGEIPNFPLLWELVHLAHANAQAAG